MQVFVLTVYNTDEDAGQAHSSVHSTEEKAREFLTAYCRGAWESEGHDGPLPKGKEVERYFEFWEGEQAFDIDERELDPDPAVVDHSPEFALGEESDL
jgi:hypothetical protein